MDFNQFLKLYRRGPEDVYRVLVLHMENATKLKELDGINTNGNDNCCDNNVNKASNQYRTVKISIPLKWIEEACKLPGKSVCVGLALWHISAPCQSTKDLLIDNEFYKQFNISQVTVKSALKRLESAGLIEVCGNNINIIT